MPTEGVEPTLPCGKRILSPSRTVEVGCGVFILARLRVVTLWLLFGIGFDISARVVASLTRSWKRWMAVSCTHGHLADPRATKAMLAFRRAYKPANVLHLGDFTDMAALRAGARRDADDPDRAESMADDLLAGLSFLQELEPSTIHLGNHEDRLCGLAHSGNAVVSYAAGQVIGKIEDFAKKMKAKVVPYAGLRPEACTLLGDTLFLHGVIFSMSAARDHAETLGMSCCFGHTHRVAQERDERSVRSLAITSAAASI
jgi:hypothetical protein